MCQRKRYDVIVAGGGPSGVAAAVAAARNGCKTLLIERGSCLGGMATQALVPAFGPFTNAEVDLIGGIGREILEKLKKDGYKSPFYDRRPDRIEGIDWYQIDSEVLKRVLDEIVLESQCDILFHTDVVEVEKSDRKVQAVCIFYKGKKEWIDTKYLIDCTGNADLAEMAGVGFDYGDGEGNVQAGTLCFRVAGVDVPKFMDYVRDVGEDGNLSKACERAIKNGDFPDGEVKVGGMSLQADGVAGLNFGHSYHLSPLDPWEFSQSEIEARKKLPELIAFLRKYVPGMENCVLVSSGIGIGIRESRRIHGRYTLTGEDYFKRADFEDAIAYYSYPVDLHPTVPGEGAEMELNYQKWRYENGECYGIPYRCLIPDGLDNLAVAGRNISADRIMMASIRMMPPCFATGQAAGTACAIAMKKGINLDGTDAGELRRTLKKQGLFIKSENTTFTEDESMKIQIISTSCNRRELELEQLKRVFEINGYSVSKEDFETDKDADYILLSTCGFTQAAEDFALKTLERINQEKKRECEVIIGGCLPKIHGEVLKGYRLFDPRNYEILDEYFMFEHKFNSIKRPNTIGQWQMHSAYREHGLMSSDKNKIDDVGKKTVKENIDSVLKIGEIIRESKDTSFRIQCLLGCACKCTYCAIKFAIGGIKSRTIEEILEDFDVGISHGYKNILLEGDSLGGYGMDIGTNLGELLECVYKKIEDKEIQISIPDVSPAYLSICCDQIILMANKKKLFNFYTPIQSGSQKILMAMKRGYDIDKVVDLILKIKAACPELKIGTSIIVGFPGETLEDFEKTLEVCRKIKFDYIYCHSYSERKGTEACYLDNKIDGEEILRRSRVLKQELKQYTPYITIAEDTAGNRTCQG